MAPPVPTKYQEGRLKRLMGILEAQGVQRPDWAQQTLLALMYPHCEPKDGVDATGLKCFIDGCSYSKSFSSRKTMMNHLDGVHHLVSKYALPILDSYYDDSTTKKKVPLFGEDNPLLNNTEALTFWYGEITREKELTPEKVLLIATFLEFDTDYSRYVPFLIGQKKEKSARISRATTRRERDSSRSRSRSRGPDAARLDGSDKDPYQEARLQVLLAALTAKKLSPPNEEQKNLLRLMYPLTDLEHGKVLKKEWPCFIRGCSRVEPLTSWDRFLHHLGKKDPKSAKESKNHELHVLPFFEVYGIRENLVGKVPLVADDNPLLMDGKRLQKVFGDKWTVDEILRTAAFLWADETFKGPFGVIPSLDTAGIGLRELAPRLEVEASMLKKQKAPAVLYPCPVLDIKGCRMRNNNKSSDADTVVAHYVRTHGCDRDKIRNFLKTHRQHTHVPEFFWNHSTFIGSGGSKDSKIDPVEYGEFPSFDAAGKPDVSRQPALHLWPKHKAATVHQPAIPPPPMPSAPVLHADAHQQTKPFNAYSDTFPGQYGSASQSYGDSQGYRPQPGSYVPQGLPQNYAHLPPNPAYGSLGGTGHGHPGGGPLYSAEQYDYQQQA